MSRSGFICGLALLAAGLPTCAQLSAPVSEPKDAKAAFDAPHLRVELLVPNSELYLGGDKRLNEAGLYFKLEPGWHVYWKNAGDSGEPPHINLALPKGISATPMQFPAPKRLPLGPLMDFGYDNEVLFPFSFVVTDSVYQGHDIPSSGDAAGTVGPFTLRAKVDWLVCREVCIPGKADLQIQRRVYVQLYNLMDGRGPSLSSQYFGDDHKQLPELPISLPKSDSAIFQPTPTGFRLALDTGQRETQAVFFPSDQEVLDNPSPQTVTPTAKGLILDLKKDTNLSANPAKLNGVIELSGGRAYDLAALPGAVAAAVPPIALAAVAQSFGLAFLGGLLLNLMPCVFPVLFLKGLSLVNSGNEERHKLRAHGFVYTLGILVSFWVLVGALLALRAAGATLGWGFQFQSPVFLALMAGLLFFLGLSLAGQFEIGLTLTSAGGSLAAKQGYTGSFFTGVLAVVVATPCSAPFMGAAIGYALAQPAAVTFAVFTALALGLAAPYLALTLQPAWTRLLPKPGAWMEVLRQAISVPIFITVIWLAWVLAQGYGANALAALLGGFLLLAVAGWFLGRWPAKRWSTVVAGMLVLAVIAMTFLGQRFAQEDSKKYGAVADLVADGKIARANVGSGAAWQPWSADAVAKYQAAGRPVFVDFTASWCLSCQVNERIALSQPQVQQAFAGANVALLKADWTREDPAITEALTALGRSGVPVYALYVPGENDPLLLPQVLTPGIVTDALDKLPKGATSASVAPSN